MKTLEFTPFSPLPITDMQGRYLVSTTGNGCCYTAVHSAAHQYDGFGFVGVHLCQMLHFMWVSRPSQRVKPREFPPPKCTCESAVACERRDHLPESNAPSPPATNRHARV